MAFDVGLGKRHLVLVGAHYEKQLALFEQFVNAVARMQPDVPGMTPVENHSGQVEFSYLGVRHRLYRVFNLVPVETERRWVTILHIGPVETGPALSSVTLGPAVLFYSDDGAVWADGGRATGLVLPADAEAVFSYLAISGWERSPKT